MQHIVSFAGGLVAGIALTGYLLTRKRANPSANEFLKKLRQLPTGGQSDRQYELWKYYTQRADELKDKLWTTVTWLIALEGALLVFMINEDFISFQPLAVQSPLPVIVFSVFGFFLSWYSIAAALDGIKHIHNNWFYAGRMLDEEKDEEKKRDKDKVVDNKPWKEKLQPFPQFRIILVLFCGIAVTFVVLFLAALGLCGKLPHQLSLFLSLFA